MKKMHVFSALLATALLTATAPASFANDAKKTDHKTAEKQLVSNQTAKEQIEKKCSTEHKGDKNAIIACVKEKLTPTANGKKQ